MEEYLEELILGLWQGLLLKGWKKNKELRRLSFGGELIIDWSSNFFGLVKITQSSEDFILGLYLGLFMVHVLGQLV